MERLGTVERIAQGLAVVRAAADAPELGAEAVDEDLDVVGRVVDVFGPVEEPFVAVSPADDVHLPATVGRALYVR